MGTEYAVFFRNAEGCGFRVGGCRQRRKLWSGFDSDPEDSRRFCSGEESVPAEMDLHRSCGHFVQSLFDLLDSRPWLLADELERDVQRLGIDPAHVGREPAHSVHVERDTLTDGVIDVEGDEEAHEDSFQLLASSQIQTQAVFATS